MKTTTNLSMHNPKHPYWRLRWLRWLMVGFALVSLLLWLGTSTAVGQNLPITPFAPSQEGKLLASDGVANDNFGWSVAIDGNTAVVGAPWNAVNVSASNPSPGAAYVYVRQNGSWTEQAILTPDDGVDDDEFGIAVAISGDRIIVGAHLHDGDGAAYVFTRTGSSWSQEAKLIASDGAAGDGFGIAVALDGDTAVVGAYEDDDNGSNSGSAYVFIHQSGSWNQQARIAGDDIAGGNRFGRSVAVQGDTAVVGAPFHFSSQGAVYVFGRDGGGNWSQQEKIVAADIANADLFGHTLALDGDTILVGSYQDDAGAISNSGSAYLFVYDGQDWLQQAKIVPSDPNTNGHFGRSVALYGDTAVVGAPGDNEIAGGSGATYIFTRHGGSWHPQAKQIASDAAGADRMGHNVALHEDTIIAGSYGDDDNGSNSGSAYVLIACTESTTSGDWSQSGTWLNGLVPSTYHNACIRATHTVTLTSDVGVNNLTIQPDATLHLETHALTVEGTVNHQGTLRQTQMVNDALVEFLHIQNSDADTTKYRGVGINSDPNNVNLGATTVTVRALNSGEYCTLDGASSPPYARLCYDIAPENQPTLGVTLRLYAPTAVLNGIDEADLRLYHWNESAGEWQLRPDAQTGTVGDYSYAQATVTSFSPFLLGSVGGAPTAVLLNNITSSTPPNQNHIWVWALFSLLAVVSWVAVRGKQ